MQKPYLLHNNCGKDGPCLKLIYQDRGNLMSKGNFFSYYCLKGHGNMNENPPSYCH